MSNTQSPIRTSLLVTGAGLVFLSQWLLQGLPLNQRGGLLWLSVIGTSLFLIPAVSVISDKEGPTPVEGLVRHIAEWFHVSDWQLVLLFASPFFSWIASLAAGEGGQMINPLAALLAWLLAISAAIIGSISGQIQKIRVEPVHLLLPLSLTLLALIVRGVATDRIPILLSGDEGSAGIAAMRFVTGKINNPFISDWFSFPSLYIFIQSLSIRIFGETTQALRLTSALAGALTVTSTYLAGRVIFDRRTGLMAAIFLAAYSYHIHFSRLGINDIWDGLWYMIVIGAVWYGWQHEEIKAFTVAGFCLGIAQYFYATGRILLVPILAWLILAGFFNKPRLHRMLPGVTVMFLVGFVIVLPLGLFYLHHPNDFMAPFSRENLIGPLLDGMVKSAGEPAWRIVLTQLGVSFGAFTYIPLRSSYIPGTPLLLPLPASLFLLGILILLIRSLRDRFLLLALWILTFGLIGGLSESAPAAQRYIGAAPVCALLVGYGLSETTGIFETLWPKLNRILYGAVIAITILMAVNELNFYFLVYTPKTIMDWNHENGIVAQRLADYLKGKPADLEVVFFGGPGMGYTSIPSLQYLAPNIAGIDAKVPWDAKYALALHGKTDLVFVFLPGNEGGINLVENSYPAGQLYTQTASDGKPLYWYYEYHAP